MCVLKGLWKQNRFLYQVWHEDRCLTYQSYEKGCIIVGLLSSRHSLLHIWGGRGVAHDRVGLGYHLWRVPRLCCRLLLLVLNWLLLLGIAACMYETQSEESIYTFSDMEKFGDSPAQDCPIPLPQKFWLQVRPDGIFLSASNQRCGLHRFFAASPAGCARIL